MADNKAPEETIFSKIIRQEIPAPLLFQEIYHIHMHLVGGQPLGRMLAPK